MEEESPLLVTPAEAQVLVALSSTLCADPTHHPVLFCQQAESATDSLPPRIKSRLAQFAQHGSATGYLLLRSVPINTEVDTPPDNKHHVGETTGLARIQALLVSAISHMVSYEAEGEGRLFQDIVPTRSMATHQTSTSSGVELEIHTEQAFSTIRPDILSLACVRGDPEALTYVLPVQTLRNHLTEDEQGLMRTPLWMTGVDMSFQMNDQACERGPMSILVGPNLVFDQDLMKGVTEDAEKMIEKVVAIYYRHRLSHCLVPGDILLLDNRRAVHGRSQFHPVYNGRDRFLIRCFGMYDLARADHALRGRMMDARFS